MFVAFAAFWKSGLRSLLLVRHETCKHPALQSALRRDRRATPPTLKVRHAETSLQATQRHLAHTMQLATVGSSSLQGAGKCCSIVCAIRCRAAMACARARLPRSGASFAQLLLSRNTARAFSTHLSSFSRPPSGRVLLCGPFAPYLRFCSTEALGKVRLFASFILIVRSFSIGDRKTSPRPASAREHAAS